MPVVHHGDIEIHYDVEGADGDPIVFVHGYTGDRTDWRHQVRAFAAAYQVVTLDLRGHGRSTAPSDRDAYTIDAMRGDAEAVLDAVGSCHLVGHSMGGGIAQEIALASPERLLSLVLVDTADVFDTPGVAGMLKDLAERNGMRAIGEAFARLPLPNLTEERRAETAERLAAMSLDAFVGASAGLMAWPGSAARLNEIAVPSLVVCGDMDPLLHACRRLASGIRGARLEVIADAFHSPQDEKPEPFNDVLRSFLESLSS